MLKFLINENDLLTPRTRVLICWTGRLPHSYHCGISCPNNRHNKHVFESHIRIVVGFLALTTSITNTCSNPTFVSLRKFKPSQPHVLICLTGWIPRSNPCGISCPHNEELAWSLHRSSYLFRSILGSNKSVDHSESSNFTIQWSLPQETILSGGPNLNAT